TTLFNPYYIQEKMKSEATAAAGFAEIVQNTYGWNVMKPEAIDDELWDEVYNVYVQDKFNLGVKGFFEKQNPAALEEMTAVMMETARKGMWNASPEQLAEIAKLHTELVDTYKPSCSGFVCNNAKLREFIASNTTPDVARQYEQNIRDIRESSLSQDKSMVLKREELNATDRTKTIINNTVVIILAVVAIGVLVMVVRRRRKKMEE
ncbi:MAG: cobaltochelatase subunit CobN, partial [Parabacteroides sp.]|nr:cobaltochelatase subunit CobN [Parabacteroides sp.]